REPKIENRKSKTGKKGPPPCPPLPGSGVEGEKRGLAERDAVLVCGDPLFERLQLGIERSRQGQIARAAILLVEVVLDLEHVAQILRAGESDRAVGVERDGVVDDLAAQRPAE